MTARDDLEPWDLTSDTANPQPNIWPVCPTCHTPWAWRRYLRLTGGATWCWSRDCKHKAQPVLHTAHGEYLPEVGPA